MTVVAQPPSERSLTSRDRVGPGRVGSYALMGVLVGVVPIPWLPTSLAQRVRGALLYDIAGRAGLSLTPEARRILIAPTTFIEGPEGLLGEAFGFAARRVLMRLGPLAALPPIRNVVMNFGLGHLFAYYVAMKRNDRAIRIDTVEARRVRHAIDQAMMHVFTTPAKPDPHANGAPEELRDQLTQATDGVLNAVAGAPAWVLRRLEAAFDVALESTEA